MKLLERLKKIKHFNIQADETNQCEDRKIKMNDSYENNHIGQEQEEKKSEGMSLNEMNSNEKHTEGKTVEEKNPDKINPDSPKEMEVEYEIVEKEILPEKIICPDCGGITLEGLDFCDKCGGELHIYNR